MSNTKTHSALARWVHYTFNWSGVKMDLDVIEQLLNEGLIDRGRVAELWFARRLGCELHLKKNERGSDMILIADKPSFGFYKGDKMDSKYITFATYDSGNGGTSKGGTINSLKSKKDVKAHLLTMIYDPILDALFETVHHTKKWIPLVNDSGVIKVTAPMFNLPSRQGRGSFFNSSDWLCVDLAGKLF